ncbi:MAG: VOC family protein [Deltaproteobacteria bacterium]
MEDATLERWRTNLLAEEHRNGRPGIHGGIMGRQPGFPPVVNTIGVESVDEFVKKVTAAGGKVVAESQPIPGVGYQAYCKDTEGNLLGIHQPDPSAK